MVKRSRAKSPPGGVRRRQPERHPTAERNSPRKEALAWVSLQAGRAEVPLCSLAATVCCRERLTSQCTVETCSTDDYDRLPTAARVHSRGSLNR